MVCGGHGRGGGPGSQAQNRDSSALGCGRHCGLSQEAAQHRGHEATTARRGRTNPAPAVVSRPSRLGSDTLRARYRRRRRRRSDTESSLAPWAAAVVAALAVAALMLATVGDPSLPGLRSTADSGGAGSAGDGSSKASGTTSGAGSRARAKAGRGQDQQRQAGRAGPDNPGQGLARAVALAKERTAIQAKELGLGTGGVPARVSHASPSEAATALLQDKGVSPSPAQQQSIASLDALPPPTRSAMTGLLDAFAGYQAATKQAYAGADTKALSAAVALPTNPAQLVPGQLSVAATPADPGSLLRRAGLDLGPVLSAQNNLLDAAQAMSTAQSRSAATAIPSGGRVGAQAVGGPPTVDLAPVLAIDPVGEDNLYTADYFFVLDVGGNDVYKNNAGGGKFLTGAASLLDMAGNDQYTSGGDRGVNGGGNVAAGSLIDAGGDDAYAAGDNATNGGGTTGTGLLVDGGGNDSYTAGKSSTNGGSSLGSGNLVDASGNDTYTAAGAGANGGGFIGAGSLLDGGGNDTYIAGDTATNGGTNGGTGSLVDVSGDDSYTAGKGGANGGAAAGIGSLQDGCGTDNYQDGEGGTGTDKTVVPKGTVGAQIDTAAACSNATPSPSTTTTTTPSSTATTVPTSTTTTAPSSTTTTVPASTTTTTPSSTTTTTSSSTTTTVPTSTTTTTPQSSATTTTTVGSSAAGTTTTSSPPPGQGTAVAGVSSSRPLTAAVAGQATRVPARRAQVLARRDPASGRQNLAATGTTVWSLVAAGGAALCAGGLLVLWSRRRRSWT